MSNIRSSIKTIKSSLLGSKQPIKIKFVKKRNESKNQKFFSQWDIKSGIRLGFVRGSRWYFFLSTSLSIYWTKVRHYYLFKQAKKSDLHRTEMPMWRKRGGLAQYQSNKYLPLKSVIDNNGWSVDLFAVKVGAKLYCSTSVLSCFKSLGTAPSIPQ